MSLVGVDVQASGERSLLKSSGVYETAAPVCELDADTLTPAQFARECVARMRPAVIRGVARHWPACQLWQSPAHLLERVGNPRVSVATGPVVEYPWAMARNPLLAIKQQQQRQMPMAFEHFLTTTAYPFLMMRHVALDSSTPLGPLGVDVGDVKFLPDAPPPRSFPRKRALLYRNSYTDWHYHEIDETLMCQVVGTKEVLLAPPDAQSFATLNEIANDVGYVYDVDVARFPGWRNLRSYRAVVRPGDGLYLPTFWWHAVEATPNEFGITVPWCWATPAHLFDVRLAGARNVFRRHLRSRYGPIAAAAAAWSIAHGALSGRLWRKPFAI
jgi:hypothetical protein